MHLLRRDGYRRMPWRNGQGLTEEILALPEAAGIDSFDWRLSIAHVGADGPFSLFPGIDRTIALLDGAGLALDLPEGQNVRLEAGGDPFTFPGEWAISGRNAAGPTIDLNIMTRRGRCRHAMRRLQLKKDTAFEVPARGVAVFNGSTSIATDGGNVEIGRFDALMLDGTERFQAGRPVEILWTTITRESVAWRQQKAVPRPL